MEGVGEVKDVGHVGVLLYEGPNLGRLTGASKQTTTSLGVNGSFRVG